MNERLAAGNRTAQRKLDQLEAVLTQDVGAHAVSTGFEQIRFEHCALPELAIDSIDLSTQLFGKPLRAPLLISSMTGGVERARRINTTLAEIAQSCGIALAVGSQRIALEGQGSGGFDRTLRMLAPTVPIVANIGGSQLLEWTDSSPALRLVDMIEADALVIHLNPLQEVLQAGGDRDWRGVLSAIAALTRAVSFPVLVKEVGAGISPAVARRLLAAGVSGIDVAGTGGTSWAAVVAARAPDVRTREIAETFRDWGIPTATALCAVRAACPETLLIASGGMRTGLDAAKAVRLGADLVGFAAAILPQAVDGAVALADRFERIIAELRVAAFCTGSANLADLRSAPLLG